MLSVTDGVNVQASPETVFDFFADVRNEIHYNPMMRGVQMEGSSVGMGTRYIGDHKKMGRMDIQLTQFDRPKQFAMKVGSKMGNGTFSARLTPAGGGTNLESRMEFEPKGMMKFMAFMAAPMMKKQMRETHARLKAYLEKKG